MTHMVLSGGKNPTSTVITQFLTIFILIIIIIILFTEKDKKMMIKK